MYSSCINSFKVRHTRNKYYCRGGILELEMGSYLFDELIMLCVTYNSLCNFYNLTLLGY